MYERLKWIIQTQTDRSVIDHLYQELHNYLQRQQTVHLILTEIAADSSPSVELQVNVEGANGWHTLGYFVSFLTVSIWPMCLLFNRLANCSCYSEIKVLIGLMKSWKGMYPDHPCVLSAVTGLWVSLWFNCYLCCRMFHDVFISVLAVSVKSLWYLACR